ncbi:MAG: hypothetical protein LBP79_01215 [Clostridiales bacterium]|jgi:DNA-directed RNA polymerase specialized sigma subunit|nr:hypothetical protein [Clostridiales bacterium]
MLCNINASEALSAIINAATDRQRSIVECRLSGKGQREIAAEIGISQSRVSHDLTGLKERYTVEAAR